ncbi:glutathione peroxidase 7-like [Ptychodera flava]|uniref:glutathione peroxidase 7-like n=1 Tax=Ptychodera flava TaxID=63121 RepID=UPI003969E854
MAAPMKFSSSKLLINVVVYCLLQTISHTRGNEGSDFYSFTVNDIHGNQVSLGKYRGMVTLVVNVASECGYTDGHYQALSKIQDDPALSDMFTVLAFPCNQFGNQEPKPNELIYKFVQDNYGADFPMFSKIDVAGDSANPAYKYLTDKTSKEPTWNFWKYLVDPNGDVINAWGPWASVDDIYPEIVSAVRRARGQRHGDDL